MISVTIGKPDATLDAHWADLSPFAHNVFMHPAALRAASETVFAMITVLLAWDMSIEPAKLVGLWAVQNKHLFLFPILETLPFNYAFLSTPVLHPDYAEETVPAFLAAVARERTLPKTLYFRDLDAQGREYSALEQAIGGHAKLEIRADQRPIATRESGLKRSGSTRKKLRQDWNRLAATGNVEVDNVRDPARIGAALESFLKMEAKSWKGAGGTALLSDARDAAFVRRFIHDLAARGEASVALLKLDGNPIAAQVLLYGGRIAYTWKTSFDPDFGKHSPGTLLVDRISIDLIDEGTVDVIDSCARGDSFMAQLWSARKPIVDMVVSATPRPSASFMAVAWWFRSREVLKQARDRLRRPRSTPKPTGTPAAAGKAPVSPKAEAASVDPASPAASERGSTADRAA